jgi:hypothetical protein
LGSILLRLPVASYYSSPERLLPVFRPYNYTLQHTPAVSLRLPPSTTRLSLLPDPILSGATIPAGSTLYYEMRVRSRVFASIVGPGGVAQQENFLEVDQVAKLNAIMGIGQD